MSIEIEDALSAAREFFAQQNLPDILEVYETDKSYIVFGGIKGQVIYGINPMAISKEGGTLQEFTLPSEENFAILDAATKIEM